MQNITIKTIEDNNIERCRELCNELMSLQKSRAIIHPECFDSMNFDTRMKKSFDSALRKNVLVAEDNGKAIAYIYSSIDEITKEAKLAFPPWAPKDSKGSFGFYPDWLETPQKVGCLNNLYVKNEYRSFGLGQKLTKISLDWLLSFDDTKIIFVYISNGNDSALKFYLNNGFTFSHDVFNGFIKAAYIKNKS